VGTYIVAGTLRDRDRLETGTSLTRMSSLVQTLHSNPEADRVAHRLRIGMMTGR